MDLKKEDGRTAQTWTCSGGNPQQVSFGSFCWRPTSFRTDHNDSPGCAFDVYVGIYYRPPSLPLNSAGTSLKRRKISLGVGTAEQTEDGKVNEFQIGIEIGMDNQTKRSEKDIWTIR
jgi:hypothetical protein